MKRAYRASCHCGKVVAEAALDLEAPSFRCNCSICRRTRFWPAVAAPDDFRLLQGDGALVKYVFAGEKNHHFFCGTCGVRVFGVGNDTPVGEMIGVNLGCLEGVSEETLSKVPVVAIDGMHDRMQPPEFAAHL